MAMPTIRLLALASFLAVASTPLLAQHQHGGSDGKKMDHAAVHGATTWKEMDAFHRLLASTYHPVAGKQDLAPLRAGADSLASAAAAWAASPVPAACGGAALGDTVSALAKDAGALAASVKGGAGDDVLKAAITTLHDRFEGVEKRCGGHGDKGGMKH